MDVAEFLHWCVFKRVRRMRAGSIPPFFFTNSDSDSDLVLSFFCLFVFLQKKNQTTVLIKIVDSIQIY